jgi:hypothetical protein
VNEKIEMAKAMGLDLPPTGGAGLVRAGFGFCDRAG